MTTQWPVAVANGWHPVALCRDVTAKPLSRMLMDVPLVVFRGADGPVVMIDRCPHRGAPLSGGRVSNGQIICPYHGWQFGSDGRCVRVPGSAEIPDIPARLRPAVERAGLVWTTLSDTPSPFPALPVEMEADNLDAFWWAVKPSTAHLLDAVENLLDPAHPHFLHPELVRSPQKRREVRVELRAGPGGGEARYFETSTALTWLPRLFEGKRTFALGRYFAPTIGQVAFENKKGLSVAISVVFVPETADRTRPYAHFATRRGILPAWIKRLVLIGFHIPVLRQDQAALASQAQSHAAFGGHDYAIGPLDFFGPVIWRLANGRPQAEEMREFLVQL